MQMKVHLLKFKKSVYAVVTHTYLANSWVSKYRKIVTARISRWSDFACNYIGFAWNLLADSLDTEKKTEETDQQHTISKVNMQNELLLWLGNMQVFIALAPYL